MIDYILLSISAMLMIGTILIRQALLKIAMLRKKELMDLEVIKPIVQFLGRKQGYYDGND